MAQPKLEQDMNFVQQAPLEIQMFEGDMNIIQKLDDEPNDVGGLSAQELKAEFDKAGNTIKTYLNDTLIPAILADDATEKARQEAEAARVEAEKGRVEAETARIEAENLRLSAETARIQAETERQTAESTRIQNEEARIQAETARAEAEARREDKETGYVAQAAASATSSKSWAVGGTGSRPGEDTDNAKYYSEVAKSIAGGGVLSFNGRGGEVIPQEGDYTAEMVGAVDKTEKAAPNGVATLDENGQVTPSQLKNAVPGAIPAGYQETLKTMLEKLGETVPEGADVNTYPAIARQISPKLLPDNLLSAETAEKYGVGKEATVSDILGMVSSAPAMKRLWSKSIKKPTTGRTSFFVDVRNLKDRQLYCLNFTSIESGMQRMYYVRSDSYDGVTKSVTKTEFNSEGVIVSPASLHASISAFTLPNSSSNVFFWIIKAGDITDIFAWGIGLRGITIFRNYNALSNKAIEIETIYEDEATLSLYEVDTSRRGVIL